ncbi:MAG: DivIVA domain-containing protein [Clostridia bacterium]|nr:DivIVA domain-containing protein [Clostridia bacterium]
MFENQASTRITIRDIEAKQFRRIAYGYDQRGVDEFLDAICDELELLYGEIDELKRKLDYANAQTRKAEAAGGAVAPAAAASTNESFQEILEAAQRVKGQIIADAEVKAEEIREAARIEAEARLGGLDEERDALEKIVSTLRTTAREYKEQFGELLRTHQEALDNIDLSDGE